MQTGDLVCCTQLTILIDLLPRSQLVTSRHACSTPSRARNNDFFLADASPSPLQRRIRHMHKTSLTPVAYSHRERLDRAVDSLHLPAQEWLIHQDSIWPKQSQVRRNLLGELSRNKTCNIYEDKNQAFSGVHHSS